MNRQGKYIYRVEDGTVYDGSWMNGFRSYGQLTFADGSYYRGDFINEQMTGKGVFVYKDRSQYDVSIMTILHF